jgi:hypothetical protein
LLAAACVHTIAAHAQPPGSRRPPLPHGAWGLDRTRPILEKTATLRLAPSLGGLTAGERACVGELVAAGRSLQSLYEAQLHRQALASYHDLVRLDARWRGAPETRALLDLYRLSEGPIVTTLDNDRQTFLPVDSLVPGKAFYPWGVRKDEIERYLETHPERRATILDPLTVVRRADAASIRSDRDALARRPGLALLHPRLAAELEALARRPDPRAFYAVPYAVAYADTLIDVRRRLDAAADAVAADDPAFARYLRLRGSDLLLNDYEAGDAAWVTSRFRRLNAEIGAFETYDDELYGVKASHGLSVMVEDSARTRAVREAIRGLQAFEDALPYAPHKKVREDIPVGVYDVVADFGQARGTNTATILPNDSDHARRYGRTILLRRNLMLDPVVVASSRVAWTAAVAPQHAADFDPDGSFYRTLWHELGHYLGPDRDRRGREMDQALEEESDTFEEMKADLVSLFVGAGLARRGYYSAEQLRRLYAAGALRTLLKSRPRRDQAYGTMELMQFNWYQDHGALGWDASGRLLVHPEKFHAAVTSMLEQVLAIQQAGDREQARRFIERWTAWTERHERLASRMRETETSRFRLVRYAALGE